MSEPNDNPPASPAPEGAEASDQSAPVSPSQAHSSSAEQSSLNASAAVPAVNPPPGQPAPQFDPSIPDDLRTPWGWPDMIIFFVFVLGSSLVLPLIAAIAAIALWGVKPEQLTQASTAQAVVLTIGQLLWSVGIVGYLYITVRLRRNAPFWKTIGWKPLHVQTASRGATVAGYFFGGMGMAILVGLATERIHTKGKLPIEQLFQTRKSILMLMLFGTLVAPLVEETIFRGYIYPVLARGLGIPAGIILTGMLFGLMHAQQLWGGWAQIGLITLVGIVLTMVRARTGTVFASFLVHLGYNGFLFLALLVGTHGLRDLSGR